MRINGAKRAVWFFTGTVSLLLKILLTIIVVGVTTTAICAAVFALYIGNYVKPYLETVSLEDLTLNETSFVYAYDRDGNEVLLEELYGEENRIWVDYDEISPNMVNALIAIEDTRFKEHKGVDWVRTFGAMVNMVVPLRDHYGGGSTITQQLIKNITGDDDVTVKRKITEILRALEFEKIYSKEEILEAYLNTIYFGSGCYGVETAAKTYFGVHASELSVAQSATLAGLISSPTYYNPRYYPENNIRRRNFVLSNMKEEGMISETEYRFAKVAQLDYWGGTKDDTESRMQSYYVDQVINDVISDLVEQYGYSESTATTLVYSGGYSIYANVDLDIQAVVDKVYENSANFPDTESSQELQSAITIMDPYTGRVLAMSGGVGEKTVKRAWNRATMTKRAPGSSIKPISVYAPGIEYNLITPVSVLDDSPFIEETRWPKNQNGYYSGRCTVKTAVAKSLNTVAVKVLDLVTLDRAYSFATVNMGLDLVSSMEKNDHIFSDIDYAPLALGGLTNGVTVLEMTAAYSTFVNEGVYTEPTTYSRVVDKNGNIILENEPESHVAMERSTAFYINQMLTYVVTGGTGRLAQIDGITTAGKTGTTTNDFDRWFVGYTPYYCAAVWVGYDRQAEIKLSTSVNPALAVWKQIMAELHTGLESKNFFDMETGYVKVCLDSGMLADDCCNKDPRGGRTYSAQLLKEDFPTKKCDIHKVVTICDETGMRATPYCQHTHEIALLNVTRDKDISVGDNAYVYKPAVYADAYGASENSAYNTFCTTHTSPAPVFPTEPDDDGSGIDNGDDPSGGGGGILDWIGHLFG